MGLSRIARLNCRGRLCMLLTKTATSLAGTHSVAYSFLDRKTGGRLLVAPDVGAWNDALIEAMQSSDAILLDGTFWSGDELSRFKANARTAAEGDGTSDHSRRQP